MQFLADLLEKKWCENNITILQFYHNTNIFHKGGKIRSHGIKDRFLTEDKLFLLLYVYDGV